MKGALPKNIAEVVLPEEFIKADTAGDATLRLSIDENGEVTAAELLSFSDEAGNVYTPGAENPDWYTPLEKALVSAALATTFQPATACGEAIKTVQLYTVPIKP